MAPLPENFQTQFGMMAFTTQLIFAVGAFIGETHMRKSFSFSKQREFEHNRANAALQRMGRTLNVVGNNIRKPLHSIFGILDVLKAEMAQMDAEEVQQVLNLMTDITLDTRNITDDISQVVQVRFVAR